MRTAFRWSLRFTAIAMPQSRSRLTEVEAVRETADDTTTTTQDVKYKQDDYGG
jgi:hypothetical protein